MGYKTMDTQSRKVASSYCQMLLEALQGGICNRLRVAIWTGVWDACSRLSWRLQFSAAGRVHLIVSFRRAWAQVGFVGNCPQWRKGIAEGFLFLLFHVNPDLTILLQQVPTTPEDTESRARPYTMQRRSKAQA